MDKEKQDKERGKRKEEREEKKKERITTVFESPM